ncbi:MAG: RNA polymerase sigma-54 factor, partial [Sulfobacillus thermotolerans]|nr:RNA polymerase sigma-54 factor [Sulfobacillus thermotolerans]
MTRQHLEQALNQVQHLTLSPALMLSLKVLELPTLELASYLRNVIDANPIVELIVEDQGSRARSDPWPRHEGGWDDMKDIPDDPHEELYDDLRLQVACLAPPESAGRLAEFLIDHLDPDGYLRVPLTDLAQRRRCTVTELEQALEWVWRCEPAGVGARNLAECLWLQARRRWGADYRVTRLLRQGMPPSGAWTVPQVARTLKISMTEAIAVLGEIRSLEPRPYAAPGGRPAYVTPDVLAWRQDGGAVTVEIVRDHYPTLRYDPDYLRLRRQTRDPAVRQFLTQALRQAAWVEQALNQRARTLWTVSQMLVTVQHGYCFDQAPLTPLTVKRVAEATGFHESTVRRAVWGKILGCARGLVPLSTLFCEPVHDTAVSTDAVKTAIRALIEGESPDRPLSDADIAARLNASGLA